MQFAKKDGLIVKDEVIKKDVYNELVKNVNAIDTSELPNKTDNVTKIKDIEAKMPSITNLATNLALTAVENKTPNVSTFLKKTDDFAKTETENEKWLKAIPNANWREVK